ncbi:hypothetical protein G4G28_00380 [Massilia sp. Dwa41.01b]|nr:FecR domain-containing protein [Massilia sp. Dwa41.01b]QNA87306.1 hypothetical protein G4G28_00380 [Massilia sp. Dwa41.01b]
MKRRLSTTATLLALAAFSTLVLADEAPGRVGRVSLTQGQVSISTPGEAASTALVNWPVTSNHTISTAPGARTELRIGSTAIRLDGDSALDVVELDDDRLRLRLHYGSASIRVVNPEVAAAFELSTPQARVILQQPGRVRVDAERVRDTSSVNVFDGVAVVEGGGERLTRARRPQCRDAGAGSAHHAGGAGRVRRLGGRARPRQRRRARHPLRAGRDDRLRGSRPLRQLAEQQRIRQPVAAGGRQRLGALPRRPLDLDRPRGWTWVDNAPRATRPSTMAAGCTSTGAGPGRRAATTAIRCGRRPWSAGWAAAAGT